MYTTRLGIAADNRSQIAERIATLGAVPNGVIQTVAAASTLPPYPADAVSGNDHLTALADRFAELGNTVREQIDQTAELGDADTSDLLIGFSRMLDQSLWFVEAHLTD
ncbi:MAG: ferritin-like domain-containing protein [Chromatiales bacterium]|jgi:starvation-inducible DNA-binding protein